MEQSTERKAHGVKVFLGTFKSSRDAIAGMVYPVVIKDGDVDSNATSSHPTEMNSLTCQLFWSPSVTCITLSMKMI